MKLVAIAALAALASALAVGCAANTDTPAEATDSAGEAVSAAKLLLGKWDADSGPIYKIEFTSDYAETLGGGLVGKRFAATVDNGIRCVRAPCPSTDEVSGVYAIRSGKLVLASYDRATATFARYLGDYRYTVTSKALTMHKTDGTVDGKFHHAPAGVACGTTLCAAGLVCCNPLMNICTKPGMMCIQ